MLQGSGVSVFDHMVQVKDGDFVSKIRILQQDSFSLPNTFCDGGSTTSEGSCAAVRDACAVLVERMKPIKEMLAKNEPNGEVSWESLCYMVRFNLFIVNATFLVISADRYTARNRLEFHIFPSHFVLLSYRQARNSFIDLQSHALWAPPIHEYLLFGAGVSEVKF